MAKSKKNVKQLVVVCALVGILSVGSILAYFTDADTATNTFTVGKVSIDLVEENWDPDTATQITPLEELAKDPKVENNGVNDAFVFLEVVVPYAEVTVAAQDGTKAAAKAWTELFSYTVDNTNWAEVTGTIKDVTYPIVDQTAGTVTHLYAYGSDTELKAVAKDTETTTLFDYVRFANVIEDEGLEGTSLDIVVNAYAIQTTNINDGKTEIDGDNADGKTSPSEVWSVLYTQSPEMPTTP
ncbi:MAG: Camelysin metallo-endopeptidase [Lachnospiraceae bacterium]|nr:Camelysin metallo-endopeptidase [Lachnospiraceae bacterium]